MASVRRSIHRHRPIAETFGSASFVERSSLWIPFLLLQRATGVLSSTAEQECRSVDALQRCSQIEVTSIVFCVVLRCIVCVRPTDLVVIAVASNNLAVLNRDQNLFDSRKRIKTAAAPETELKLNSFQKKIVQVNEALLAIYTGQVSEPLAKPTSARLVSFSSA
jgi:hypothetical protein